MANVRDMSSQELAQELVRLASNHPTSGNLRKIATALDVYKGRGPMLDEQLDKFNNATNGFIRVVQRGYAGMTQWKELKEAAEKIAPVLDILPVEK